MSNELIHFERQTAYAIAWDKPYIIILDEGLPEPWSIWKLANSKGMTMSVYPRTDPHNILPAGFVYDERVRRSAWTNDEIGVDPNNKQWIVRRKSLEHIARTFRIDYESPGSELLSITPSMRELVGANE